MQAYLSNFQSLFQYNFFKKIYKQDKNMKNNKETTG